ncbi:MAG TPA: hypothetical protein V6C81_14825 [Planktothrix sp.]|jgi:hypothetical protein
MKKSVLLAMLATTLLVATVPSYAAGSSSDSFGTKMKNGLLWGPRKIGAGFKKIGDKMHGNKTPKSK